MDPVVIGAVSVSVISAVFSGLTAFRKSQAEARIAETRAAHELNVSDIADLRAKLKTCQEHHEECQKQHLLLRQECADLRAEIALLKRTLP